MNWLLLSGLLPSWLLRPFIAAVESAWFLWGDE